MNPQSSCSPTPNRRAGSALVFGMAILLPALLGLPDAGAQLEVGGTSDDVEFALFDGNTLTNHTLSDFDNQIVVLYYYTPW